MEDAKVQSHFEDQLTSLMRQYGNELLRMCCVLLRDRALAEDAVQETFLKAYRGLPKFRGDCSEKTWLICIAVYICKTMMRRSWFKITRQSVSWETLPLPAPNADEEAIELTQEVMKLPPKQREVILLYYYHGLTGKEIAKALGISGAAVSKRLKQAKNQLHFALKDLLMKVK